MIAYKTGVDQWVLTTGLPLESIVLIRDHVGSYLDPLTLDTLLWRYLPPRAEEPAILIDVETGVCKNANYRTLALFIDRCRKGK